MNIISKLKGYANKLKQELFTLYLSYKDERTPRFAKALAICVVAYAFSPFDLIPDFIPILGYLDDLIILPLGISFTLKLIPEEVLAESREKSQSLNKSNAKKNWLVGALFILTWILLCIWAIQLITEFWK